MSKTETEEILRRTYACMADLWCNPQDLDVEQVRGRADEAAEMLKSVDEEGGRFLTSFLDDHRLTEEDYIDMFELNPKCPLYLGSHAFAEPTTCAQASVCDRNGYMLELKAIFRHFGLELNGRELPDYLPLIIEFLSCTVHKRDDAMRRKLIQEYILPFLPPMRSKLEKLRSPYLHLLDALEVILKREVQ